MAAVAGAAAFSPFLFPARSGPCPRPLSCRVRAPRSAFWCKSSGGEDGVLQEQDSYLEELSLEYESVWDTKPAWCQPWTILLTGGAAITGSWAVFKAPLFTAFLSLLISAWWWLFLYSYPLAYRQMIEERRRKVKSGDEDTFGTKTVKGTAR